MTNFLGLGNEKHCGDGIQFILTISDRGCRYATHCEMEPFKFAFTKLMDEDPLANQSSVIFIYSFFLAAKLDIMLNLFHN